MSTKVTREELLDRMSLHDDIGSKAAAGRILDFITDTIASSIKSGAEIYLGQSFGGFKAATQGEKSGVALGKAYTTPAKTVIKFRPSSKLKDFVA